jgi:hypothetical protein
LDASIDRTEAVAPRTRAGALTALLMGLLFAAWLLPAEFLDPTRIDWVLAGDDSATAYLSWQFFRHEPWTMPPGRVVTYGLEMGSSLVYTDAIPLVAILLKLVSPLLPADFNYLGLWGVLSVGLTAAAAFVCGARAGRSATTGFAAALCAIVCGYLLIRLQGHFSLTAQWLVWWALAIYLGADGPGARRQRIACLVIALGVHAYLFVLVAAVVAADLMRRVAVTGERRLVDACAEVVVAGVLGVSAMWAYGYFVLAGAGGAAPDFGVFAATVDTFWWRANPSTESSVYVGAGVLAGVLLALAALAYVDGLAATALRGHWPLIGAVLVTFLFAVSPTLTWQGGELMSLGLPDAWVARMSTFRANGRLAWLAAAVLILVAVTAPRWIPDRRRAAAVLALLVVVQLLDFRTPVTYFREHLSMWEGRARPTTLPSADAWRTAIAEHESVRVAPMDHMAPGWRDLVHYSAALARPINIGYFSRASWEIFAPAYTELNASIVQGRLQAGTLYVIHEDGRVDPAAVVAAGCTRRIDGVLVASAAWCTQPSGVAVH